MSSSKDARRVSTFWAGRDLGVLEKLCIQSFLERNYQFEVYTYNLDLEVPKGVSVRDASSIMSHSKLFENYQQRGTFAAFSNIFRYALLEKENTTWVDADLMLLGHELPEPDYLFAYESEGRINGSLLRAPSGSLFLQKLIRRSSEMDPKKIKWGDLGPSLISRTVTDFGLEAQALAQREVYPIEPKELWKLFDPESLSEVQERLSGALTLHLWNEYFRRSKYFAILFQPIHGSFWHKMVDTLGLVPKYDAELPIDMVRKFWRNELNPSPSFAIRKLNTFLFKARLRSLVRTRS